MHLQSTCRKIQNYNRLEGTTTWLTTRTSRTSAPTPTWSASTHRELTWKTNNEMQKQNYFNRTSENNHNEIYSFKLNLQRKTPRLPNTTENKAKRLPVLYAMQKILKYLHSTRKLLPK
eukprot:2240935-Amphidinium_carterae.1